MSLKFENKSLHSIKYTFHSALLSAYHLHGNITVVNTPIYDFIKLHCILLKCISKLPQIQNKLLYVNSMSVMFASAEDTVLSVAIRWYQKDDFTLSSALSDIYVTPFYTNTDQHHITFTLIKISSISF